MSELNEMKIHIGPMIYDVNVVEGLKWETPDGVTQELNGSIQYSKLKINIESELPRVVQLVTLCHEIMHGILEQGGLEEHDEGLVTLLGYSIYDFIRNNKPLVMEILDEQ